MKKKLIAGGVLSLLSLVTAVVLLVNRSGYDTGGQTKTEIKGNIPNPANAPMKPVGRVEADRRATANRDRADTAKDNGRSWVAPPVIAEVRGPELGETLPVPVAPSIPPQPEIREKIVTQYVYLQAPTEPAVDQVHLNRINAQIDQLITGPHTGGFVVRTYLKGERPSQSAKSGSGGSAKPVLIARAGDIAYARLDRGFNSDDPAAPIFATIIDIDEAGRTGPLHFARAMGAISYSRTQATIGFTSLTFANGVTIPLKAMAISESDARSGIAAKVDNHYLERYGSMFLGAFLQGVGQVGQELVSQNRSVTYDGNSFYQSSPNKTDWKAVGMGTLLPIGQNLSAAVAQNVNRAPTLSSPQGMPLGLVFLEPVVMPR